MQSEAQNDAAEVARPRRRSKLAVISLVLAVVIPAVVLYWLFSGAQWVVGVPPEAIAILPIAALVVAAVATIQVVRRRRRVHGLWFAIPALIISAFLCLPIYVAYSFHPQGKRFFASGHHLDEVTAALGGYLRHHDFHLPPADHWCDDILPYMDAEWNKVRPLDKLFVDPQAPNQRSGFAMNAALSGAAYKQIPDAAKTILLFEAYGDWNQSGGPELVRAGALGTVWVLPASGNPRAVRLDQLSEYIWQPRAGAATSPPGDSGAAGPSP